MTIFLFSFASRHVSNKSLLSWKAKQMICWTLEMMSLLQMLEASKRVRSSLSGISIIFAPVSWTCFKSSWDSGGCLPRDWGKTTVRRSGLSALRAPRMTAAFVPVAPDVKMWLSCRRATTEREREESESDSEPIRKARARKVASLPSGPWRSSGFR